MAVFGCIADDFTGASDAASFLVKGGMSVRLYNGIPERPEDGDSAQAIVIALKSRTQETAQAVDDSLRAARFLLNQGARQLYFKYCSTFDSTPKGNIGPVADALMDLMDVPCTILCPALPVNGRTVEHGHLMVNGVPLHESHMKNHPLTPMWDSSISRLMEPQSQWPCIPMEDPSSFSLEKAAEKAGARRFYIIPDYKTTEDGRAIAAAFKSLPLLTGGSGLLEPLARLWSQELGGAAKIPESLVSGKALLLAGSCSQATLGQIAWYEAQKKPSYKLDPKALLEGRQTVDDAWQFIQEHENSSDAVLVYSSDTPEKVKEFQSLGAEKVASLLEDAAARLAVKAVKAGYTRIISAGGETSGAVTRALGFSSYLIGESVAPGVPIMVPAREPGVRLILKSGNFGQEDFFGRALSMTGGTDPVLDQKLSDAVWTARSLFDRGKTSGSSANMSFCHKDRIYISATGSCFGTMKKEDFAVLSMDGTVLSEKKPSKEWPLHLALYEKSSETGAVIHTHSTFSVLWSFVPAKNDQDCIPDHTPYLKMKLGTVGLIPYEKPGSEALFQAFRERVGASNGFLLKNHGPVVPGKTVMDAFFRLEELEESARIAWELFRAGLE